MMQISRDKIFVCLVGIPGSGKSTFVKNNLKGYTVISTDTLLEEKAKELGTTYNDIFLEYVNQAQEEALAAFLAALDAGSNIVWDQTNTTIEKRAKILPYLPPYYYKIAVYCEIQLETALERCIARHKATGKYIPEAVLERMFNQMEPPTITEGFQEILLV
jgi:predicted kinase